jgi:hypothetical protein
VEERGGPGDVKEPGAAEVEGMGVVGRDIVVGGGGWRLKREGYRQ